MKNKRILVISLAGAIAAGLVVAFAAVLLRAGEPRYGTQAAMLKGVPAAAKAELISRGRQLAGPLVCQSIPGATAEKLLVRCTGSTTDAQRVQVYGAALTKRKAEYYTILVAGRPLVKNAGCLGADCKGD